MQTITTRNELKTAIQILEIEQQIHLLDVKEQGKIVYNSFKPASILRSTLTDVVKSPYLLDNILGAVLGLATGYVSRKIIVGASSSVIRKVLGSVLQVGVTKVVTQNSDKIKSFAQNLISKLLHKKDV